MLKPGMRDDIEKVVKSTLKEKTGMSDEAHGWLWYFMHSQSIFCSFDAFFDSIGFYGCYALLMYTMGVFAMVLYLVYI